MSTAPICEDCDVQMVERTRKADGQKFYGCRNWPKCENTEAHEDTEGSSGYIDYLIENGK